MVNASTKLLNWKCTNVYRIIMVPKIEILTPLFSALVYKYCENLSTILNNNWILNCRHRNKKYIKNMFSFKLLIALTIVACTVAESPRRRLKFRAFARQEAAENDQSEESGPYPPAGWKPQGQRLVLPARQQTQEQEFNGYHYPKPTDSYGPPPESSTTEVVPAETEEPSSEETTTESIDETTEQATDEPTTDDPTTDNPQAENFRNAPQKFKAFLKSQKVKLQQTQPIQPVFFVQYPNGFVQQPQIFYILE